MAFGAKAFSGRLDPGGDRATAAPQSSVDVWIAAHILQTGADLVSYDDLGLSDGVLAQADGSAVNPEGSASGCRQCRANTNAVTTDLLYHVARTPSSGLVSTAMKTTIEISDSLLDEARRRASVEGTTLRALVEAGLRAVLARGETETPFRLYDASFGGNGVQPGIVEGDWEAIRDLVHQPG